MISVNFCIVCEYTALRKEISVMKTMKSHSHTSYTVHVHECTNRDCPFMCKYKLGGVQVGTFIFRSITLIDDYFWLCALYCIKQDNV